MYIPGSISTNTNLSTAIMNNNLHQQQFFVDNLKEVHRSNKVPLTSNFSFDPDLLRELNARYLHDMNATRNIEDGFRAKHTHEPSLKVLTSSNNSLFSSKSLFPSSCNSINNTKKENLSSPTKKSNKWCTAHVRICWMIYHQQQRLKDKLSLSDNKKEEEQLTLLNNKLPDLISNTKPMTFNNSSFLSLPTFNYDINNGLFGSIPLVGNSAFGGLGSLFPSATILNDRKSDMNGPGLPFSYRGIGSFASINEINNNSNKESRKRSSIVVNNDDNHRNSHHSSSNRSRSRSPHPSLSRKPSSHSNFDSLTLSIIERQRLSAAYASLFASTSQPNIDPTLFRNNNFDSSSMTAALIQREHFLNSLRLLQQHQQIIGREGGTTVNNNSIQIHKTSKIKFEQTSLTNNERIKSPQSISSKKRKHEEKSVISNTQNHDLISKEELKLSN